MKEKRQKVRYVEILARRAIWQKFRCWPQSNVYMMKGVGGCLHVHTRGNVAGDIVTASLVKHFALSMRIKFPAPFRSTIFTFIFHNFLCSQATFSYLSSFLLCFSFSSFFFLLFFLLGEILFYRLNVIPNIFTLQVIFLLI